MRTDHRRHEDQNKTIVNSGHVPMNGTIGCRGETPDEECGQEAKMPEWSSGDDSTLSL